MALNKEKQAKFVEAIALISSGKTLTYAAKQIGVAKSTLHEWMALPENAEHSTRARVALTHSLADECIEIADEIGADPADKRIRIDTRIRLIGKWNRKDYGDKTEVSGDPDAPLQLVIQTGVPRTND